MDQSAYEQYLHLERYHFWRVSKRHLVLEWLQRYIGQPFPQRTLDIGGASSAIAGDLSELTELSVVEPDPGMVEIAIETAQGRYQVSEGALPDGLPDEQYDLITLFDVLEHIEHDDAALRKISEKLHPGGYLCLTVPALRWLWSPHDESLHHYRRYVKGELVSRVEEAGFTVLRCSYYTSLLLPLVAGRRMVKKLQRRNPETAPTYEVFMPPHFMNNILKAIMTLERYILRVVNLPLGSSLILIAQKR